MYKCIVVPVDLAHTEKVEKALQVAAELTKLYGASLHIVAVTSTAPSAIAHNPEEFTEKLNAFAAEQGAGLGVSIVANARTSPDPAIDLDDTLSDEIHTLGADLVVMASHVPGFREFVFASNAGFLASHADISVLVVR